jgi:hypothetical protein
MAVRQQPVVRPRQTSSSVTTNAAALVGDLRRQSSTTANWVPQALPQRLNCIDSVPGGVSAPAGSCSSVHEHDEAGQPGNGGAEDTAPVCPGPLGKMGSPADGMGIWSRSAGPTAVPTFAHRSTNWRSTTMPLYMDVHTIDGG